MDGFIVFGLLLAGVLAIAAANSESTSGMMDTPVSAANIRRGVQNGWYTAVLTRVDGKPAVRLSGKLNNGTTYSNVYPISQSDFDALQADGYLIEL